MWFNNLSQIPYNFFFINFFKFYLNTGFFNKTGFTETLKAII